MLRLPKPTIFLAAAAAASFAFATPVCAAQLGVKPVTFSLAKGASSGMLTVENQSNAPVRLQVSVATWSLDPNGEMHVAPTEDIVAFPELLTVAPHEKHVVRFGVIHPGPAAVEQDYRIFLQELPGLDAALGSQAGESFQVRTKLGIPVFIAPAAAIEKEDISGIAVHRNRVSVTFENIGTVHTSVTSADIVATDASGRQVAAQSVKGWYLLPGGKRNFEFELAQSQCSKIASITATVRTQNGAVYTKTAKAAQTCI